MGPPNATTCIFQSLFMVNNMVFRWPKHLFFMVLGAHGWYSLKSNPCQIMLVFNIYLDLLEQCLEKEKHTVFSQMVV